MFFGGQPIDGNPLSWAIAAEVRMLMVELLALDSYCHLRAKYQDRPNPAFTALADIAFNKEDELLVERMNMIQTIAGTFNISVFTLDGAIVDLAPGQSEESGQWTYFKLKA